MNVEGLFLRAASARGLGAVNSRLQAPKRRGLAGLGTAKITEEGDQGAVVDVGVPEPKYTASFMSPTGTAVKSSFEIWKPGTIASEPTGSGGGFWSTIADTAGKIFTGALNPQQGYLPPVQQPSSPWPWVVGGVAVVGLGVLLVTRKK
ncbi:MAG: hypothetical protein WC700_18225 [Gemmatimonadaceae bacterium]|jgi:hypothetical protein